MEIIPIIILLGLPTYWVYLHISFRAALKREDPALYGSYSNWSPVKYTYGFALIELVLTNKHLSSSSEKVINVGNRLRRAYELKYKVIGLLLFLSALWVGVSFVVLGVS